MLIRKPINAYHKLYYTVCGVLQWSRNAKPLPGKPKEKNFLSYDPVCVDSQDKAYRHVTHPL